MKNKYINKILSCLNSLKHFQSIFSNRLVIAAIVIVICTSSCKKFLEVDVSKSQITKEDVFNHDATAISAVTGIYNDMITNNAGFASGGRVSIMTMCALSANEIKHFADDASYSTFETYNIKPVNPNIEALWTSMYFTIYGANNAIEGLNKSTSLTPIIKNQLTGEALFIRAFAYFNLINLFGDIPLVSNTNFEINAILGRMDKQKVYSQIIEDLVLSQSLMSDEYATSERVRPNRSTATALLCRVYFYLSDWKNAELLASQIISNEKYVLSDNIDDVFLKESKEAIWQLKPSTIEQNTNEARIFILYDEPSLNPNTPYALTQELLDAFESNDLRRSRWTGVLSTPNGDFTYSYKYKENGASLVEYSIVFRLAEIYLIRSEARAHLANTGGAISDLDAIRGRAGLPLISVFNPSISISDLILKIEHEKQIELFTEWGHRWFDLKRTGRADVILKEKPGYNSNDKLYPLPQIDMDKNFFLRPQNPGY